MLQRRIVQGCVAVYASNVDVQPGICAMFQYLLEEVRFHGGMLSVYIARGERWRVG